MIKWTIALSSLFAAMLLSTGSASALECGGITVPNSVARSLLNSEAAGVSHRINRRKTLVINEIKSISGTGCKVDAKVDVTLKRKIRRNAKGTVTLKGNLRLDGGRICVANAKVDDVNLSNTLRLGEAVYRWVANMVLPNSICF